MNKKKKTTDSSLVSRTGLTLQGVVDQTGATHVIHRLCLKQAAELKNLLAPNMRWKVSKNFVAQMAVFANDMCNKLAARAYLFASTREKNKRVRRKYLMPTLEDFHLAWSCVLGLINNNETPI